MSGGTAGAATGGRPGRWLVTGAAGMLGSEIVARLRARDLEVAALTRADLDLRDHDAVRAAIGEHRPDTVVNCAAWTAVDAAEEAEAEALALNGDAVAVLARACASGAARLVQISTDYVFDGTGTGPYAEDAPTAPANAYGRTKLAGERAVLEHCDGWVIRTAWLYGGHGPSFVHTMMALAAERETVSVVKDQHGPPTWTGDLAERIIALAASGAPAGVYHGTNAGHTSWYGLAREVFTLLGLDHERVLPTTSDAFPRPARRPANSVLGHDRWALTPLPPLQDWRAALHEAWPLLQSRNSA